MKIPAAPGQGFGIGERTEGYVGIIDRAGAKAAGAARDLHLSRPTSARPEHGDLIGSKAAAIVVGLPDAAVEDQIRACRQADPMVRPQNPGGHRGGAGVVIEPAVASEGEHPDGGAIQDTDLSQGTAPGNLGVDGGGCAPVKDQGAAVVDHPVVPAECGARGASIVLGNLTGASGGAIADLEGGITVDDGVARVGVVRGEDHRAASRSALADITVAADRVRHRSAAGAVEGEHAVIDDAAGSERPYRAARPDLEGAGRDRGGARISISTGEG